MHEPHASRAVHRFGPFRLDVRSRVLYRESVSVPLPPRTFDLLLCFVTSGGRLLTKQELLGAVWGDVHVEEGSVAFQVSLLRKALGEPGVAWIETVPKHGYRFTAPVTVEDDTTVAPPALTRDAGIATEPTSSSPPSPPPVPRRRGGTRWIWAALGALAVVSAAVLGRARTPASPAATPVEVVPLTSYPGVEQHPTFSPDGTQIAFSWEREGRAADIYVVLAGEGAPVILADDPAREVSPAWSPDGRLVAFCRESPAGAEVIVVPATGGQERRLALAGAWRPDCDGGQVLSWFPQSDALAVAARRSIEGGTEAAVHRLPLSGGRSVPLTTPGPGIWGDTLPAVSPDGRHLAFARSESGFWVEAEIHLLPLTNAGLPAGPTTTLVPDEPGARPHLERVTGLAWGSGDHLLFSRAGLWRVSLTGNRQPTRLPLDGHPPTVFSTSRTGARLAFAASAYDVDIFEVDGPRGPAPIARETPGGGVPALVSTFTDTNPQFSADGRRIAFTSTRSGRLQIWLADANGDNSVQLTQATEGVVGTPRWSPDGRYLAYDAVIERGRGDIMVIPVAGGPARRVTPAESHEQVPSWSRDGRWIYLESNRGGRMALWKVEVRTGRLVQVTELGGAAAFESPDARFVYYGKRGTAGLWRRSVAGGAETRVSDRGHAMFWGMHETGACWMDPTRTEVLVECMDLASGRVSTVAHLKGDACYGTTGPGFAVSPDGTRILFARVAHHRSDLMLADVRAWQR